MAVNLGSAHGKIVISTSEAQKNVQSLSSSLKSAGTGMSAAITAPLVGIATVGLKATAAFSQNMNQVQAVTGATASAMEMLQGQALQLGRDTSFSSGEASKAMLELGKAGLDTTQIMGAMPGVLDLAAAGGISVARSAELAANAMNAFSIPAENMVEVADLLAAGANNSATSIDQLSLASQQSSSSFATNGQSLLDMTTALALMANAGIKGSDAGTSLKTAMQRLSAPTDKAQEVLDKLGISVFDASGKMLSFEEIIGDVARAAESLSDADRADAFNTIFGQDAIRAANVLASEGAAGFARMKAELSEVGAAGKVADARLKGLAGAIEFAKGSIESTLISAFLPFEESIANVIRSAADLVSSFTQLPQPVQNAALAFAAVLAAAGPLALAIAGISTVIGVLISPIGLVVAALAGLAVAFATNFGGIRDLTMPIISSIMSSLMSLGNSLIANIPTALSTLRSIWSATWPVLQSAVIAAWATIEPIISTIAESVSSRIPSSMTELQSVWSSAWSSIQQVTATAVSSINSIWTSLVEIFGSSIARLRESFNNIVAGLSELSPKFGEVLTAATPLAEFLGSTFVSIIQGAFAASITIAIAAINLLAATFEELPTIVGAVADLLIASFTFIAEGWTQSANLVTAIINGEWTAAWNAAQAIVQATSAFITSVFTALATIVTSNVNIINSTVVSTLTDMGVNVQSVMSNLRSQWINAWAAVRNAVVSAVSGITGTVNKLISLVSVSLPSAMSSLASRLGSIRLPNPFAALSGAASGLLGRIRAVRAAISSLSSLSVSIPGFASGTTFAPGGLALVGERGPELVTLPRGARVDTAQRTRQILDNNDGPVMNVTIPLQVYGNPEPETVRRSADRGVRDAAWALGINLTT